MVSERVKRPRMWLAASYTVEASWVMAICLGIVCMLILLGYEVYHEALVFARDTVCEMGGGHIFSESKIADAERWQVGEDEKWRLVIKEHIKKVI